MKTRRLTFLFLVSTCLAGAVSPALARETPPDPTGRGEARQKVVETSARYRTARVEADRLAADVARIEARLAGVERSQAQLRVLATRGFVALYMHDPTADFAEGLGGGSEEAMRSARRARLIGGVNELAQAAGRDLADSARQIEADRKSLGEHRRQQEVALSALGGDRHTAQRQLSALAAADRAETLRARAERAATQAADRTAARALQRTSRGEAEGRPRPPLPLEFRCPLAGPFTYGDLWGAGRGHKGNDLMAPRGTENVATATGTIESRFWGGGGLTLFLHGDDGNTYVYMHLLRVVGDQPRQVEAGELIGLTGASGNASAYHTHFELHPGDGPAVDPHALLVAHCP